MKKLFIGIVFILLLLAGAIILIPSLVPSSVYKEKIQTQLSKELQRDVAIDGDVKLSVFPSIRARTERVVIANPDGFKSDSFASMDGLEAKVKLLPLLSKRVEIAAFKLKNPVINLEKNTQGQANWVMGETSPAESKPDAGPFKRDGRFTDIDPSIGLFSIENGAITYADVTADKAYDLSDVNVKFSLPSLSNEVKIDGDMLFNGEPVDLKLSLNTPRDFLDGKATPINIDLKTNFADLSAKGEFLQSQDIAFDLTVDGDVTDVSALAELAGDLPASDLLETVKLKGKYRFDGEVLTAKGAQIEARGELLDVAYKGDATLAGIPVLEGNIDVDLRDIPKLAKAVGQDLPGLEIAKTLKLKADMNAAGKGFTAKNIDAKFAGNGLNATFQGSGAFAEQLSASGAFTADAVSVPGLVKALDMDIPQAAILGNMDVKGQVSMNGDQLDLDISSASTSGDNLTASWSGKVSQTGEEITASGKFEADVPSVSNLVTLADLEVPQAKAVERLSLKGTVDHSGTGTKLNGLTVSADGGVIAGQYEGDVSLGDILAFNGNFDTTLQSLTEFAEITGTDVPYAGAIGKITAKGNVTGQGEQISISGLTAKLSDGQINGGFDGSASMDGGFNVDGQLNTDIPSLRALAETTGTKLPPSTDAGKIYEQFSVSGAVKGNPANIAFEQAKLTVDHLTGSGDFTVDMTGAKPLVSGLLNLDGLDLRPYMASYAAQNPTGDIQPWSEDPINVAMLNSMDGNFTLNTPNIITDRMSMGEANIDTKIRNGKLTTTIPKLNMYGGLGNLTASIDGSGSVPQIAMKVDLDDLNSNKFLSAVAGFTQATGNGNTLLDIKGSGRSQADIMKSLNGQGDFKLLNGQLSGLDMNQMLSGFDVDQLLASRSVPGIGSQYSTKFNDIIGLVSIQNGVANLNKFDLNGLGYEVGGEGKLDLGNQSVDFRLHPRQTGTNANTLSKYGIPVKCAGKFGSISCGLDESKATQMVAAIAKDRLKDEITKGVGGTAGDILGGMLDSSGSGTSVDTEDVVTDVLGGLLGSGSESESGAETNDANSNTEEEKPKADPKPEDLLLDLFGGGKKD